MVQPKDVLPIAECPAPLDNCSNTLGRWERPGEYTEWASFQELGLLLRKEPAGVPGRRRMLDSAEFFNVLNHPI